MTGMAVIPISIPLLRIFPAFAVIELNALGGDATV